MALRPELEIISEWIAPGSRILDLGCGDGVLLKYLRDTRNVNGYGIEIDDQNVLQCIEAGVNIIQTDLDAGLSEFDADSFDYVVMSQTLQAVHYPDRVLDEMLRVGREGIVTFPNFGHWLARFQLAITGHMPVSNILPYDWYNSPNLHLCTVKDFEQLCTKKNIEILERTVVDQRHKRSLGMRFAPNLLGEIAIYRFRRGKKS
ncbi:MAG: methionine biosynthesis protein MetW [Gammaproteobacteria bacterium]|nr:MAG: methionine biosynthesis protein MetW [Gammaproteobacteria bacterium]TND03456.1 MAG: methionine biosynthesis protein MetW [Gammaproteobacteria bacterium]